MVRFQLARDGVLGAVDALGNHARQEVARARQELRRPLGGRSVAPSRTRQKRPLGCKRRLPAARRNSLKPLSQP